MAFFWGSISSTVSFVYCTLDRYFCFGSSNITLIKVNGDIYKVDTNSLPINSHITVHIPLTFQVVQLLCCNHYMLLGPQTAVGTFFSATLKLSSRALSAWGEYRGKRGFWWQYFPCVVWVGASASTPRQRRSWGTSVGVCRGAGSGDGL